LAIRPRKDTVALRKTYLRSRRAEVQFAATLRSLARRCGEVTRQMFDANDPIGSSARIRALLFKYSQTMRPWAQEVAKRMVLDVKRRDETFWTEHSKSVGRALKEEIKNAPTGVALRELTQEAAALITSMPLEAAQRIEKFAVRAMTDSSRIGEVVKEIMRTGHVTKSRANLIARTEVARTSSILVQTRAVHVGSEGYIWRTSNDIDVRNQHRKLAGKFIRWDSPPIAGPKRMRYHAGQGPNCRCYCEVVVPDEAPRFRAERIAA
jgi:SPP1 gp7 family putative phage head morphogenesis protein